MVKYVVPKAYLSSALLAEQLTKTLCQCTCRTVNSLASDDNIYSMG